MAGRAAVKEYRWEGMTEAPLMDAPASGLPLTGLSSQASVFSLLKE